MMNLPDGASEPPERMLTAMIELEDLHSESEFLRGNPPIPTDWTLLSVLFSIRCRISILER